MWTTRFVVDAHGVPVGKNRIDSFRKRRPQEFLILLSRVQALLTALNARLPVAEALSRGWVHVERAGVFALDPGRSTLRLYCCLDMAGECLYVLTVGDKKTQDGDVRDCARWIGELKG